MEDKLSRHFELDEGGESKLEEWSKVVFDDIRQVGFICTIGCLGKNSRSWNVSDLCCSETSVSL